MGDPIHHILRLPTGVYGSLRVPDHPRAPVEAPRVVLTHRGPRTSEERDELALRLGIALDVPLGHRQAGMPREFLDVPETAPDL